MKILIYLTLLVISSCTENGSDPPAGSSSVLKLLWQTKLNKVDPHQGFELPLIDGDRVYFHNGPDIDCRDLVTGKELWKANISGQARDIYANNLTVNSHLIVVNDIHSTKAFNKLTGELLWMSPDSGVFRDDFVMNWCDENYGYRNPNGLTGKQFAIFNVNTGQIVADVPLDTGSVTSLVTDSHGLFANTRCFDRFPYGFGEVMKFDPVTGTREFKITVKPRYIHTQDGIHEYLSTSTDLYSVPLLDGEVGYSVFDDGTVLKYRLTDGKVLWKFELDYTNYWKDFPKAHSIFLNSDKTKLFITGQRDNWYCLNPETGKLIYWKRRSDNNAPIDRSGFDGKRYVFKPHAYTQWEWYIIDIETGEVIEEFDQANDSVLSQDVKNGYVAAFGVLNFYVYQIVK